MIINTLGYLTSNEIIRTNWQPFLVRYEDQNSIYLQTHDHFSTIVLALPKVFLELFFQTNLASRWNIQHLHLVIDVILVPNTLNSYHSFAIGLF